MRVEYWSGSGDGAIAANELPGFFADWVVAGVGQISGDREDKEASQPIYERMSLMHILLLAQGQDAGQAERLEGGNLRPDPEDPAAAIHRSGQAVAARGRPTS